MSAKWSVPAVVIITGIQASGKSTVGQVLAKRISRSAFIDGDDLAGMVISGGEGMTPDPSDEAVAQLELRYAQAASLADSFHREGFTAVMSDNVYGEDLAAPDRPGPFHSADRRCADSNRRGCGRERNRTRDARLP